MSVKELREGLKALYKNADVLIEKQIAVDGDPGSVLDYEKSVQQQYRRAYLTSLERVKNALVSLRMGGTGANVTELHDMTRIMNDVDPLDPLKVKQTADRLAQLFVEFEGPDYNTPIGGASQMTLSAPKGMPTEVHSDISADIEEIKKCFAAGCYRSTVILCGRVLEVALHRKYYDATGRDALEKSPGIGLGNLIAKMRDKGVELDPALSQQVHLVNQVRVFSVHKKQQAFVPSRDQAHAIVLYTSDILKKFFN